MTCICLFCGFETDNLVCPRCVDYKGMIELDSDEGREAVAERTERHRKFGEEEERKKANRDVELDAKGDEE